MKKLLYGALLLGSLAAVLLFAASYNARRWYAPGIKGHLSSVRSAIQVYYGDNKGWFPTDDLSCLAPKYLDALPLAWQGGKGPHAPAREVVTYSAGQELRDTGKWAYFNDPADKAAWGNFIVDCTHEDEKGAANPDLHTPWSTF